ncbi:hypothetical protein P7K49_018957 [Saguinus oedipus]|uniref:Fibronectin type-III domain-containing protein n=1 Tax=Saguinus oedipus TaxID=9490 RepID=A0ABQ9UW10_SAGOE|nr:hypothetical protein P7K49_018957 [Saguinus oedipus]
MTSEWTTYYEIAATVSLTASVRIANLLPAWYYNFRVTMVTWGDPELSCCDSSTISFITAPVAPEITSVEYFNSLLYISWTYGDDTTDLSHSRMLHWMVVAEGKKKIKKSVTRNVMTAILSLPPGDIYNLSVTACTERGSNTSMLHLVKLVRIRAMIQWREDGSKYCTVLLQQGNVVLDDYVNRSPRSSNVCLTLTTDMFGHVQDKESCNSGSRRAFGDDSVPCPFEQAGP